MAISPRSTTNMRLAQGSSTGSCVSFWRRARSSEECQETIRQEDRLKQSSSDDDPLHRPGLGAYPNFMPWRRHAIDVVVVLEQRRN